MQNSFPKGEGAMAAILGLDISDITNIINNASKENICQIANDNARDK